MIRCWRTSNINSNSLTRRSNNSSNNNNSSSSSSNSIIMLTRRNRTTPSTRRIKAIKPILSMLLTRGISHTRGYRNRVSLLRPHFRLRSSTVCLSSRASSRISSHHSKRSMGSWDSSTSSKRRNSIYRSSIRITKLRLSSSTKLSFSSSSRSITNSSINNSNSRRSSITSSSRNYRSNLRLPPSSSSNRCHRPLLRCRRLLISQRLNLSLHEVARLRSSYSRKLSRRNRRNRLPIKLSWPR